MQALACQLDSAGQVLVLHERELAADPHASSSSVGRGDREPEEIGGGVGRSAGARAIGCVFEAVGDCAVGFGRRKRKVTGLLFELDGKLGEACMQLASCRWVELAVQCRADQRMADLDGLAAQLDRIRVDRERQTARCSLACSTSAGVGWASA